MKKDSKSIKLVITIAASILALTSAGILISSVPQAHAQNDIFGVGMIYASKQGGEAWYMDMVTPSSDSRFDPDTTMTKNSDGSWKVKSTQVRMNVFPSTGYDPSKIATLDQSELRTQKYMQATNDWKNLEITGYVKVNAYSSMDNLAWYTRGAKHASPACEGTAYKGHLFYDGDGRFAKEYWHSGGYSFTSTHSVTSSIKGKWIGYKVVVYDTQINGVSGVKLESYLDANANNNWVKIDEYFDKGGWGTDGTYCNGVPDEKIVWGGPVAAFRWDSASDVDIKNFSVREIVPTPSGAGQKATTIKVNSISSVAWDKDIKVTGSLVDSSNVPVAGKKVTFDGTGGADIPDATTKSDGTFESTGKSPKSVATGWKVQAHFAGDSDYKLSDSNIVSYDTVKRSAILILSDSQVKDIAWGLPTSFPIALKGTTADGSQPITGEKITFQGTGVLGVSDPTTDSNGQAAGKGTAPDKTVQCGYTVQAKFAGSSLYKPTSSATWDYCTLKRATSLGVSVSPASTTPGGTFKVYGTLKDSTGAVLQSQKITFTAQSITIKDATTDDLGKYLVTGIKAPSNAGTYNIQAKFAGDNLYNSKTSSTKTLTVAES